MTTRTWTPLATGHYDDLGNWGGVAPTPGGTDVIASLGGPTPSKLDNVLLTASGASQAYLYNFAPSPLPMDSDIAQIPLGDTIADRTLVLQGDGSEAVADIRRTTLAASSTLDVSGTAVVNAAYDNALDGTFTVGDPSVTSPNLEGATSQLDINQFGYGSVDLHGGPPSTYRPDTTNFGTITAAYSSFVDIQLITGQGSATEAPTQFGDLVAVNGAVPGFANFTNDGAITIGPNSLLYLEDDGAEAGAHYGNFINNGSVLIQGAQSASGTSFISAPISGSGTITVDGGTQADPTATMLHVNVSLTGAHVVLRDATLFATDGYLDTRDTGGSLDLEGNAVLRVNGEGDTSTAGTPAVTTGLLYPFAMPIYGFGAGDVIENDQAPLGLAAFHSANPAAEVATSIYANTAFGDTDTTYTFFTAWNQVTHDLSVEYTTTTPQSQLSPGGGFVSVPVTSGPFLIGDFTLMGTYNAADFHATFTPGNTLDANGNLLEGTPGDGRVDPEVMVTTTNAAPTYAVTTTAGAAGGTVFTSAPVGGSVITATASGNDVVQSTGNDTINTGGGSDLVFASGGAATVNGGAGALTFVAGGGSYSAGGGSAADVLYGGSGNSTLTGGAGANSIIVAGTGNASLLGGAGSASLMFGGTASSHFVGSVGGGDTLVGGAGENSFTLTAGDIAFGGPAGPDSFTAGAGASLIVEGTGATTVVLGSGSVTAFGGPGADTYVVAAGSGSAGIVGFKPGDRIVLSGGSAADAARAIGSATTGSFGTQLTLEGGTQVILYGANVGAGQIVPG